MATQRETAWLEPILVTHCCPQAAPCAGQCHPPVGDLRNKELFEVKAVVSRVLCVGEGDIVIVTCGLAGGGDYIFLNFDNDALESACLHNFFLKKEN